MNRTSARTASVVSDVDSELRSLALLIDDIRERSSEDFKALVVIIKMVSERLRNEKTARRVVKSGGLLGRLRAAHTCSNQYAHGFEQIEPAASGERRWRCLGCDEPVTLAKGGA